MSVGRAVCVTGMHRSGTSLAARAMHLVGVDLGDEASLLRPGPDNPAGYWENRFVKELDDELLAHLGGSWDHPPVLDPAWEDDASLDPFRTRAEAILHDAFGSGHDRRIVGWKDPRLALLLPFWRTVTPVATTIVVVRDPAEVAASLRTRNGLEAPHSALLWLRYVLCATTNDPGHLLLEQGRFFDDPSATLAAIAAHIGTPPPDDAATASLRAHVDSGLRHYVGAGFDASDGNPLVDLAARVWGDGAVDTSIVPDPIADAVRWGWLRSPADTADLVAAKAEITRLRETLRKRSREVRQLTGRDPYAPTASRPVGEIAP
jgi:hypothetical protein